MKYKITLINLGYAERLVDLQKVKKWASKLFEIIEIRCVDQLPESEINDGYLDHKYTIDQLHTLISCPNDSDFAVAIMPYKLIDNFYMHRIGENCVVISLYGISEILGLKQISIENFIVRQLYGICAVKYLVNDSLNENVYELFHRDTRGCIFDMNGERTDILYNTETPIICDSCKNTFKYKQIDLQTISTLEKELKCIKKPLVLRIELFIKKYPLFSAFMSGLMAICLNILANFIWDLLDIKI